jgi:ParB family chromosome partitioning protein
MSNNSKGLGKGLGALISLFDEDMEERDTPTPKKSEAPAGKDNIQEIDVNSIDNNTSQPRKNFNQEEMHELEQSILANGVLQPILLNRVGSRYMIVAGERRWRAAKAVGLKTIPAIVREYTPKQIAEIALVENLMRSDLNEIEVANGIKKLMDTHLMTQEQVSKVLGVSRSSIANSLRFLNLPKEVQLLLEQKRISAGHAKCLAAVSDAALCVSLAMRCADGEMTVRELEIVISGKQVPSHDVPPHQSLELRQFVLSLTQMLATKVYIQGDDHRGRIIIEYTGKKDLERIMAKLNVPRGTIAPTA